MSQVYKADINGEDGFIPTPQGFLDYEGVKHLWSKVSMKDYPNNETLAAVINAIDETKADKSELFSGSWNDLSDKPFGEGACQITVYNHPKEQIPFVVVDGSEIGLWDPVEIIVGGITFIKILDFGIGLDAVQRATIDGEYIYPPYYWKQTEYTDQYVKTEHIVSVYEGDVTLIFTPVAGEFSKGTYLNKYYLEQGEVIIPENKLIDEKFIPNTIARVSDIPVDTVTNSELHPIAKSGSWNDLVDKPFEEIEGQEIIINDNPLWIRDESEYLEEPHYNANYTTDNNISFIIGDTYRLESDSFLPEGEDGLDYSYPMPLVETVCDSENELKFYELPIQGGEWTGSLSIKCNGSQNISLSSVWIASHIKLIHMSGTTIKTLEEKYIPDTIARVNNLHTIATSGSWNDLTNKPTEFTGTYTIKGPSNVNELIPTYASFYKISDEPLTLENFANGYSFKASHESQATFYSADNLIVGDLFWPGSYGIMHPGQTFFSVLKDSEYGSNTLPRGLYFLKTTNLEHELTIYSNEILKENILPMEYLHNYTQNLIDENRLYGDFKTGGDYIYITSDNIKINDDYIYVGPYTPTQEELTKGTYIFRIGTGSYPVYRIDYDNTIFTLSNGFRLDCVYVITTPDATFPYIGIYILDQDVSNQVYMLRINGYKKFPYTKYIDNKYLKDKDGKIIYTKTKCIYETTALGLVSPYSTIQKSEMLDFNDYDRLDYKIIEVDGVDYLLEPRYRSSSDEHFLIGDIGYIALGYGGTGSGYNFYYYVLFENGEHSFAIYDTEVSYEVINEKLIPDTIARISDIPDLSTYELITTADIDAICGASIVAANEVTY